MEVLGRGFSLGFGLRMLWFLFSSGEVRADDGSNIWNFSKCRVLESARAGVAVATTLYGVSFFLPLHLREYWFSVEDDYRYGFPDADKWDNYHRNWFESWDAVKEVLFVMTIGA